MPQLLRWTVLGTINTILDSSREMWVVDSPDYLGSWWTQGELLCRSYCDHRMSTVTLRRFDPKRWKVREAPEAYRPVLDKTQRDRIGELFFDAHPM